MYEPPIGIETRRTRLLDAAEAVLLENGCHTAAIDEIARRAGMSKKTIYQIFPAKAALFEALLQERFRIFPPVIEDEGRPPRAVLCDVLRDAVEHALTCRQIALFRIQAGEASGAVAETDDALERWLGAKAAAGVFDLDDPRGTASWLFWASAGSFVLNTLLRKGPGPTAAAIDRQVGAVVGAFLAGADPPSAG